MNPSDLSGRKTRLDQMLPQLACMGWGLPGYVPRGRAELSAPGRRGAADGPNGARDVRRENPARRATTPPGRPRARTRYPPVVLGVVDVRQALFATDLLQREGGAVPALPVDDVASEPPETVA